MAEENYNIKDWLVFRRELIFVARENYNLSSSLVKVIVLGIINLKRECFLSTVLEQGIESISKKM